MIASPFTIVVDTREQMPWWFTGIPADADKPGEVIHATTKRGGLASGDYSVEGLETRVAIERKSVADLFASVGRERDRFEREIERLAAMEVAAVVVEGDVAEIAANPPPNTRMKPKAVLRTMLSWSLRYPRVHWWPMPSRRLAEIWTYHLLRRSWELMGAAGG